MAISHQLWVLKHMTLAKLVYLQSETVILEFCWVKGMLWHIGHWTWFDLESKINFDDYNIALVSQGKCVSYFISSLGWGQSSNSMADCNFFNWVLIIEPKSNEEIQCYILLSEPSRINKGDSLDIHQYLKVQGLWYSLQLNMFHINILVKCMVLQSQNRCILVFALFMKFEYKVVQVFGTVCV